MSKTYYGYIRVSTVEQGKGASPDEQRDAIVGFAERNDLTIIDWFEETTTAAKAGRREFTRMLANLNAGKASGVIIHKIDRSARNLGDWARIGELVDRGVEVRFVHNDLDITTRGGRLTADIQAVIAADFIRNNREEVRKGMYGWLKRGYCPFGAPIGYLNRGRHKLKEIDPQLGPLVIEAFRLYATKGYSLDTLRALMMSKGLVRTNGRPLSKNSLSLMLRNPFYSGIIRLKTTGEAFEGAHEPLITPSLFDRVQRVLDGRVFARPQRYEFMFRRLIRCATCPRTLTAERQKGHVYYRCHSCPGVSLNETHIEHSVGALLTLAFDDRDMGDIREIVRELSKGDRQAEESRLASVELDLANVADRLARLTDALVDGAVDKEAFNERKAGLLAERARLRERQVQGAPQQFWQRVLTRFELWKTAYEGYFNATDTEKRELLISLGSNFTAQGKELLFAADFPLLDALHFRGVLDGAPTHGHIRIDNLPRRTRGKRLLRDDIARFMSELEAQNHFPDNFSLS